MLHKKPKVNIYSVIFFVNSIKVFSIGVFSLLFSLHCYSSSMNNTSDKNKSKYECGNKCSSLDTVVFELRANKDFYNNSKIFSEKMNGFDGDFNEEIKKLNSSHKIDFKAGFRLDSFDPSYVSQKSALRVYINISKDQCNASGINLDVVSLAEHEVSFDKIKCENIDGSCFDNALLNIFQKRIIQNVVDPVLQHVQY